MLLKRALKKTWLALFDLFALRRAPKSYPKHLSANAGQAIAVL
jgi:hypothetical protein